MKLNLPARAFNFVAPFRATIDIRHYLMGIYVRPMTTDEGGGVMLAATNGHCAGIWRAPCDDESQTVCERPVILRITPGLLSACRTNTEKRRVVIEHDRLVVIEVSPVHPTGEVKTDEVYIQPATGWVAGVSEHKPWELPGGKVYYPDMMRVVPDACDTGPTAKMNTAYLTLVSQAFRAATTKGLKKWGMGVHMRQVDRNQSILVVSEDMPEAAAIIMPMRDNQYESPIPAWVVKGKAAWKRNRAAVEAPLPVHEPSDAGPPEGDGRGWQIVRGQA